MRVGRDEQRPIIGSADDKVLMGASVPSRTGTKPYPVRHVIMRLFSLLE